MCKLRHSNNFNVQDTFKKNSLFELHANGIQQDRGRGRQSNDISLDASAHRLNPGSSQTVSAYLFEGEFFLHDDWCHQRIPLLLPMNQLGNS